MRTAAAVKRQSRTQAPGGVAGVAQQVIDERRAARVAIVRALYQVGLVAHVSCRLPGRETEGTAQKFDGRTCVSVSTGRPSSTPTQKPGDHRANLMLCLPRGLAEGDGGSPSSRLA